MDRKSKDIKRISDIAIMQSGIYMKSDPAGNIKYLQVKDINPGSKPDYSRITTVEDRGIGDQYWLRKMIYYLRLKEPLIIVFCMMG